MTLNETCAVLAETGRQKGLAATRTPVAYLMGCLFAGAFVGIALVLAYTCAAGLPPGVRPLVLGAVFGVGLILVVFAGGDMFTGGVLYGTFGLARRTAPLTQVLAMLVLMWVGNLIGSMLLAWLFATGGGGVVYSTAGFLQGALAKKIYVDPLPLLARAALCNWLVCLALWTPARLKSEPAKIIVIAWCLLAFVACGFEHCVANMTAFTLGLLQPHHTITLYAAAYNLLWVTLGNMIGGGVFVGCAYLLYARTEASGSSPTPSAAAETPAPRGRAAPRTAAA